MQKRREYLQEIRSLYYQKNYIIYEMLQNSSKKILSKGKTLIFYKALGLFSLLLPSLDT